MDSEKSRLFYLITYPRVASNLLVKILSIQNQPNVISNNLSGYFFLPAFLYAQQNKLRLKHVDQWSLEEKLQMRLIYQDGFDKLQAFVDRAEHENKILFVKEHADFMADPAKLSQFAWSHHAVNESAWSIQVPSSYGWQPAYSPLNDTILPDSFLRKWHPIFLIRHPALVFPSYYRAIIDNEGRDVAAARKEPLNMVMTMRWSRRLYELYTTLHPTDNPWPIIIDAEDIINSPQVIYQLCTLMGLDTTKLQFNWERMPEEERERMAKVATPVVARFMSTIWASEGIDKSKTPRSEYVNVDAEAVKWREEFGEADGCRLEKWVRSALPDYEFMRQKKLRTETGEKETEDKQAKEKESEEEQVEEKGEREILAPKRISRSKQFYLLLRSLLCVHSSM